MQDVKFRSCLTEKSYTIPTAIRSLYVRIGPTAAIKLMDNFESQACRSAGLTASPLSGAGQATAGLFGTRMDALYLAFSSGLCAPSWISHGHLQINLDVMNSSVIKEFDDCTLGYPFV